MNDKELRLKLHNLLELWEMKNVNGVADTKRIIIEFQQDDTDRVLIIGNKKGKKK